MEQPDGGGSDQEVHGRSHAISRIWNQIQYLAPDAARTARDGSKKAEVLDLLRRPTGATLDEIMTSTGWQAHTVRGFISGSLTKKRGLTVESLRGEDEVRGYRVAS